MLDFRMYTFITLSKTLNYTKAAEQLCISQPAVTQHIKYLEGYYQVKLFYHENKQLCLTKQGALLQKYAQTISADEAKLNRIIQSCKDHIDHIRIGATKTIGEFTLPQKLSTLIQNHPNTSISMVVENTSTLLDMLSDGRIDFAFVEGYFIKSNFMYEVLSKERYVAVKSVYYNFSNPVNYLHDLLNETLLLREKGSGTRDILERVLDEQNLNVSDFSKTIEIGNIHAIKELLKQGQGISFLYEAAIQEELKNGLLEIIPLKDFQITREFNFITLENSLFIDVYKSFLTDIKEK